LILCEPNEDGKCGDNVHRIFEGLNGGWSANTTMLRLFSCHPSCIFPSGYKVGVHKNRPPYSLYAGGKHTCRWLTSRRPCHLPLVPNQLRAPHTLTVVHGMQGNGAAVFGKGQQSVHKLHVRILKNSTCLDFGTLLEATHDINTSLWLISGKATSFLTDLTSPDGTYFNLILIDTFG
jgi:hypothetical protein